MKSPVPACFQRRSVLGVQIVATGSCVPDAVITNEHLQHRFGRGPEWIAKLTGIRERRHALAHQATSDLAVEAARRCLRKADVDPGDIDLTLVATVTPDTVFPSTACMVQDQLGLRCGACDIGAACAGFMYALVTGAAYIRSGASNLALVIGADCMSRVVDPEDLKTYPLFGDGAGAVLLARGRPEQGLVACCLGAEGSGGNLLHRPAGGSRVPPSVEALAGRQHYLQMNGKAVFNWAAAILCDSVQEVLKAAELTPADIDLYIPHQANIKIINAAMDVMKIPRERVYCNLDRYGNTSAGSVPLALDEAHAEGRVRRGDRLVLSGFGAGLTWGTAVVRW